MEQIIVELVQAADEVHSILGPGHTEATYHSALERELSERGVPFSSEGTVTIFYKGTPVGEKRPDLFLEADHGTYIVELKAGSSRGEGQLMGYLDILDEDENFNIAGGVLIGFNNDVEVVIP